MDFDAQIREQMAQVPELLLDRLGEDGLRELDASGELSNYVARLTKHVLTESGMGLAERLKSDGPEMLARRRAERRGFEERLSRRWRRAFDLAEMAIVVAYEIGEWFNDKHRPAAAAENDVVFEVLARSHARGCRIAEEAVALLRAGYGQAAMSRWRALHEVSVVAAFVAESGRETAERYLLHEHIESYRAMQEQQAKASRLDFEPYTDEELAGAEAVFDDLVSRFGPKYRQPYGWAHAALVARDPANEKERTTFQAIEDAVSLDHLRPYYRLASHGTHANPKGILFTPDLLKNVPEILLAGPGSTGLADPGQCALISLNQVTATLLTSKKGEATAILLAALRAIIDEAQTAYVATEKDVEENRNAPRYTALDKLRFTITPSLAAARVRAGRRLRRLGRAHPTQAETPV